MRKRGPFVNFWLALLLTGGLFDAVYWGYNSIACLDFGIPYILVYPVLMLTLVIRFVSIIWIYRWKKRGFHLFCVSTILAGLINCFTTTSFLVILYSFSAGFVS